MTTTPWFDDIPERLRPEDLPPIRSELDLHRFWRMILGPLGFGGRTLWVNFTDADGRMSPALQQITEVPRWADPLATEGLMNVLEHFRDLYLGGAVTICYTRPGRAPMADEDRDWARLLTAAAAAHGIALWPLHFANDDELRVFAPDDLTSARGH